MVKKIILTICLLSLTNCMVNIPAKMETWMWHDKNELIMSWGAPDKTFVLDDKITVYGWDAILSNAYGASGKVCDMNFYINNETDTIVNYQTDCGIQPI